MPRCLAHLRLIFTQGLAQMLLVDSSKVRPYQRPAARNERSSNEVISNEVV